MRFALSDDQALLKRSTRDFLVAEYPLAQSRRLMDEHPHGYDPTQWRRLAEMGYLGLAIPAEAGGQGLGAIEVAIVLEEMGRLCVPGPFLDVTLAADVLARVGGQDDLLAQIMAGDTLVTIARDDAAFGGAKSAGTRLHGGRVSGEKYFVPFAARASALLVVASEGVALVPGPFAVTPLETLDPGQRFGMVQLEGPATLLGPPSLLEPTDRLAAVGAAAMLLGLMDRMLEVTLDYVRTRQAFKRPIGSFQALQHRLAEMLLRTESTRSAVYRAAWCIDASAPEAPLACATAKAYAGDAARLVCGEAIQMHGGIGFTWELDLHYYLKRVKTLEQHYGSTEAQLASTLAAAGV